MLDFPCFPGKLPPAYWPGWRHSPQGPHKLSARSGPCSPSENKEDCWCLVFRYFSFLPFFLWPENNHTDGQVTSGTGAKREGCEIALWSPEHTLWTLAGLVGLHGAKPEDVVFCPFSEQFICKGSKKTPFNARAGALEDVACSKALTRQTRGMGCVSLN